jgi:hypothetical protein
MTRLVSIEPVTFPTASVSSLLPYEVPLDT